MTQRLGRAARGLLGAVALIICAAGVAAPTPTPAVDAG
jgi:hypothetical protein